MRDILGNIGRAVAKAQLMPRWAIERLMQKENWLNQVAALGGSQEAAERAERVVQVIAGTSTRPNSEFWEAGWRLTVDILKEGGALPPKDPAAWAKRLHEEVYFFEYATTAPEIAQEIWERAHRETWEQIAAAGWRGR